MFGQIRPVVIDENNVILAGSGLYDTLVMMGAKTAYVYRYENLTENQKKKLMIADNKIFSLGIENLDTLNCFLEELHGDLDIPGFDEEILKQMVSDAEDVTEKIAEYGTLDDEEIRRMKDSAVRKEQKIQQMAPESAEEPVPDPGMPVTIRQESPDGEAAAEIRKPIICPECGKKIWL